MTEEFLRLDQDQYYQYVSFLITSAYLMYQGEQYEELYPSLRMMDAAVRLTKLLMENGGFEDQDWAETFVEECVESFDLLATDKEAFADYIKESMLNLVDVVKDRAARA